MIQTTPESHSTIPHALTFTLDLRHANSDRLSTMIAQFEALASQERPYGFAITREEFGASAKLDFDEVCIRAVRQAVKKCGYPAQDIISGAGHDAVYVAKVCPTAMIFTPCEGGISHHPAERITPVQAAAAANVLLHATLDLANR